MQEIVLNASATNSNYNLDKYKVTTESLRKMGERSQIGLGKRTALQNGLNVEVDPDPQVEKRPKYAA